MFSSSRSTPYLLAVLALFSTPILAQNLLAGAPPCAQACAALTGSSQGCGYDPDPSGCFCSANAALPDQSTTYCADGCTDPTSQQQVVQWFEKKCSTGGTVPTSTTTSAMSTTSVPGATTTPGTGYGGNGYSGGSHTGHHHHHHGKSSWWDKHAKWIAMVIVLIVGFSIIIAVGIFFKKRHDQKHNQASNVPSNSVWGPNTSQFQTSRISEEGYGGESQSGNPAMKERSSYERSRSKRSSRH